jgi:glycine hydroxymethyltransferase
MPLQKVAEFLHRVVQISLLTQKEAGSKKLADFVKAYEQGSGEAPKLIKELKEDVMKFATSFPLPGVLDTVSRRGRGRGRRCWCRCWSMACRRGRRLECSERVGGEETGVVTLFVIDRPIPLAVSAPALLRMIPDVHRRAAGNTIVWCRSNQPSLTPLSPASSAPRASTSKDDRAGWLHGRTKPPSAEGYGKSG